MALFVEVTSVDKDCKVILNLDHVVEIAPLVSGGCAVFMNDGAGMNSKTSIHVENDYAEFKQFVMQTVSAEDIEKRFPTKKATKKAPLDADKFGAFYKPYGSKKADVDSGESETSTESPTPTKPAIKVVEAKSETKTEATAEPKKAGGARAEDILRMIKERQTK